MSERDKRGDVELSGGAVIAICAGGLIVLVATSVIVIDALLRI